MAEEVRSMRIDLSMKDVGIASTLGEIRQSFRTLKSETDASNKAFNYSEKTLSGYKTRINELTSVSKAYEKNLSELKRRHNEVGQAQGFNSKKALQLQRDIANQEKELRFVRRDLNNAGQSYKNLYTEQMRLNKANSSPFGRMSQQLKEIQPKLSNMGQSMRNVGRSMSMYVTTPIVAGFGGAIKASVDYEQAIAGVAKTTNMSGKELQGMSNEITKMSNSMPFAATEIAGVAESAGQLGVKKKDLTSFTKTMLDMSVATNLTSEEASTEFARFANAAGMPLDKVDRLGSAVVALGNNTATTEKEIVEMGQRLAGAGTQAGFSADEIMSISAAMSSVGIDAEAGGTAMTQIFNKMTKAAANGGSELDAFAKTSGMSANEFAQTWENNPTQALSAFVKGLGNTKGGAKGVQKALDEVGIKGIREADTVRRMANNHKVLDDALKTGKKGWKDNTALSKEAQTRYETLGSKLKTLKNNFVNFGRSLGDTFGPAIGWVADKLSSLFKWLSTTNGYIKGTVAILGIFAASIGPVTVGLGIMASSISSIVKLQQFMKSATIGATIATKAQKAAQAIWNGVMATAKGIANAYRFAVASLTTSQTIQAIKTKIAAAATVVWTSVTKAAALATRGLGIAIRFMTGPVGLIITAIGLLVAGVIHLWKTNATFRNVIINIWNSIKSFLIATWIGIKSVGLVVWNGIKNAVLHPIKTLKTAISVIWNSIKFITVKVWHSIKAVTGAIVRGYVAYIRLQFNILKKVISVILGVIRSISSKIWHSIKNTAIRLAKGLASGVKASFNVLKKGISIIFNGIKNIASKVWHSIKNTVIRLARSLSSGVKHAFNSLKKGVSIIFNAIRNIASKIWNAIKNKVVSIASGLWHSVVNKFNSLKKGVSNIFHGIASISRRIWNGIKKHTVGMATGVWHGVINAFNKMKNAMSPIIDKISGFINGMVNGVKKGLNKLIDGVNWVGNKLGMDKLPHIKFSTGTESTHTRNLVTNGKLNRDTFATVGDKGKGNGPGGFRHETIIPPKGKPFLTPAKDTMMPLSKGTKILSGAQTHANLMRSQFSTGTLPKFASGTGFNLLGGGKKPKKHKHGDDLVGDVLSKAGSGAKAIAGKVVDSGKAVVDKTLETAGKGAGWLKDKVGDVMDWIEKPGKLLDKVFEAFGVNFDWIKGSLPADMMKGMFGKLKKAATDLFSKWMEEQGGDGDGGYIDLSKGINFGFANTAAEAAKAGYPFARPHHGLDINYKYDKVFSTIAGEATGSSGYNGGFGQNMWIRAKNGIEVIYGHLHKLAFSGKKRVKPGSYLGISGGDPGKDGANAGSSTGPHLHYEMRWNGVAKDPTSWLKKHNGGGKGGKAKAASAWKSDIRRAAKQMKINISNGDVNGIASLINAESSGNPRISQQIHDVNSGGNEAQGLLQYVPSTFKNYAVRGHKNIYSGYDQLLAFFNNSNWKRDYNPNGGWGPSGHRRFASGGLINTEGWYNLAEGGYPEYVVSTDPKKATDSMKIIDLAAQQISRRGGRNKRPNQLPSTRYNRNNDDLVYKVVENQQIQISQLQNVVESLFEIVTTTKNIEQQPKGYNENDISKAQGNRYRNLAFNRGV